MAKKPTRRRVTLARLDESGLLTGFETRKVGPNWIGESGAVIVPDDCDLKPGRYRWLASAGRFEPLPPNEPVVNQMPEPPALRAIWKGFLSLQKAGHSFPPETEAWIAAYGKTIDAKG